MVIAAFIVGKRPHTEVGSHGHSAITAKGLNLRRRYTAHPDLY